MTKIISVFLLLLAFSFKASAQIVTTPTSSEQLSEYLNSFKETKGEENANPAAQLLSFAKKMIGIPYRFASGTPERGFDCSGFVSYVFRNFGFTVPRSSIEFSHTGTETSLKRAKVGDVLIFTGTNSKIRRVGHVGIIYSIDGDNIKFIHSTSGKANGVTISDFDERYKRRFMKVVSIL